MAEMKQSQKYEMGCGLVGAFFQLGGLKQKKVIPADNSKGISAVDSKNILNSNRRRGISREMGLLYPSVSVKTPPLKISDQIPLKKPSVIKNQDRKSKGITMSSLGNNTSSLSNASQVVNAEYTQRLRKAPSFTSSELSATINRKSNANGSLYHASSDSVMLAGHLGNLKPNGNKKSLGGVRSSKIMQKGNNSRKYGTMGNILKKPTERSDKLDPEELKSSGNEQFRRGNFEKALALYNQAIALDSSKAFLYSNKSAALMGLGHLMEAVFECLMAIRIEPAYHNAHYRLGRLYLRLGEGEKAVHHFKNSGRKASSKDISQAEHLVEQLGSCFRARKQREWDKLSSRCQIAATMGADSAPQIYAMQAEALIKLRRHEDAYIVIQKGPNFEIELFTRFLGSAECANLLTIRSQVYMTIGRFEDAVAAAKNAAKLDPGEEVNTILKRVNAVTSARSRGNKLFNKSRFSEASVVYSAALDQEPYNSVLLCNRAACRAKLGLFEKAVEDSTAALNLRPSYYKARLRRADCNVKLERWEAALGDYEVLMQEVPGDDNVTRGYNEAKKQTEREHNYDNKDLRISSNSKPVSSKEHFNQIITASDFYGNSNDSFKFYGEHGSSIASLQAIPTH